MLEKMFIYLLTCSAARFCFVLAILFATTLQPTEAQAQGLPKEPASEDVLNERAWDLPMEFEDVKRECKFRTGKGYYQLNATRAQSWFVVTATVNLKEVRGKFHLKKDGVFLVIYKITLLKKTKKQNEEFAIALAREILKECATADHEASYGEFKFHGIAVTSWPV